jgi:hypothetical protein
MDMTLARFEECLPDEDPAESGCFHAKLMRRARPDDVFLFTAPGRIRRLWSPIERHLGDSREFWRWVFEEWERDGRGWE